MFLSVRQFRRAHARKPLPAVRPMIALALLALGAAAGWSETTESSVVKETKRVSATAASEIIVQSHRGAGVLAPENTTAAFELGWSLGTWPEADLRTTRDGVIVALHDAGLTRVALTGPPEILEKPVTELTWNELRAVRVGDRSSSGSGEHLIPSMAVVFQRMAGSPERRLYLDIKAVDLEKLADLVQEHGVTKQVVLCSPKYELIRRWRRLLPESGAMLWMGGTEAELETKLAPVREAGFADLTLLQLHVKLARPVEEIRRDTENPFNLSDSYLRSRAAEFKGHGVVFQSFPIGGHSVAVYTKLMDLGVGSFATDYPDVTLQAVRK